MSNLAENIVQLMAGLNSHSHQISKPNIYSVPNDLVYKVLTFNEGETIFSDEAEAKGLYILKSGCVKLYVHRNHIRGRISSAEYVTKLVSPNELFGFESITQNSFDGHFAKAVKKSTVLLYEKNDILNLLNQMNPMLRKIFDQVVLNLSTNENTNQFNYLATVQERIAYQLINLADRFGIETERGISIKLKLTRNDFAQLASTINESLSRHLTEFKAEGLIDLDGKEIIILDREKLFTKSGQNKS